MRFSNTVIPLKVDKEYDLYFIRDHELKNYFFNPIPGLSSPFYLFHKNQFISVCEDKNDIPQIPLTDDIVNVGKVKIIEQKEITGIDNYRRSSIWKVYTGTMSSLVQSAEEANIKYAKEWYNLIQQRSKNKQS